MKDTYKCISIRERAREREIKPQQTLRNRASSNLIVSKLAKALQMALFAYNALLI